jgi:hypothetical protein
MSPHAIMPPAIDQGSKLASIGHLQENSAMLRWRAPFFGNPFKMGGFSKKH